MSVVWQHFCLGWGYTCDAISLHSMMFSLHCSKEIVDLLSWEEAFRCSSRSHPNTFSLFPPFFRTLLISSCRLFSPHIQTGPSCCVCDRQTDWLTDRQDCLWRCWMCWPIQLMWHWLCRGAAHFRDFTALLLLFPLLQCILLGAGCFLCELCRTGLGL